MTQIILASSSPYRKQLLSRLTSDFECISPDIDESAKAGEKPNQIAERLATEKATEISQNWPDHWIIGSDQTTDFGGQLIGKPSSAENAEAQLRNFSGNDVTFYTSACLINTAKGFARSETITTLVKFRTLEDQEISTYIALDNPLDCTGSFKCESLGIGLFDSIESKDPTALIGLPLISVARFIREAGI